MIELFLLVLYLAWNIGGNDVANGIGTLYGSGTVRLREALLLAAAAEVLGVLLFGAAVTETVSSALGGASGTVLTVVILVPSLWLTLASFRRMPVSATQAVVGSLIGYGLYSGLQVGGFAALILLSWVFTPAAAFLWSFGFIRIFSRLLSRVSRRWISAFLVASSFFLVFAHGSNNAGLATGFLSADPAVLALTGGLGMAAGILTIGGRVVRTVGKGITFLTPVTALGTQISSGLVIFLFSLAGIPVSTTQVVVSSVAAANPRKVNPFTLLRIFAYGFATFPVTAAATFLILSAI